MKMIKNNWFNRLFRCRHLRRQRQEAMRLLKIVDTCDQAAMNLQKCKNLRQCLALHQMLWRKGIRNDNLGPDRYGMFRTENIETMTPDEVYLGNVWGLWTFPIPQWEQYRQTPIGLNGWGFDPSTPIYDIIVDQYKLLLGTNIETIRKEAADTLRPFKEW